MALALTRIVHTTPSSTLAYLPETLGNFLKFSFYVNKIITDFLTNYYTSVSESGYFHYDRVHPILYSNIQCTKVTVNTNSTMGVREAGLSV